jgi:hypothetical protein
MRSLSTDIILRILFEGADGEPVSSKETIRALKRAAALWSAFKRGPSPPIPLPSIEEPLFLALR